MFFAPQAQSQTNFSGFASPHSGQNLLAIFFVPHVGQSHGKIAEGLGLPHSGQNLDVIFWAPQEQFQELVVYVDALVGVADGAAGVIMLSNFSPITPAILIPIIRLIISEDAPPPDELPLFAPNCPMLAA